METKIEKVKKIETELVGNSPADMIRMAVEGKADLDKLEKLLSIQERWETNEARKAFARSFAAVQENIRAVIKKSLNPQTNSKYANLEGVIEASRPIYTKEGFSVIFYESETPLTEHIRICADVLHNLGHKETYHYDVPLDGVGIKGNANMTKIHGKASSTSYARRYLMCMIWNLPTQDDDGNNGGGATDSPITDQQIATLKEYIIQYQADEAKFLKYLKVASLAEIMQSQFKKAVSALEAKGKQGGAK